MSTLEELKDKAESLGVSFHPKISETKLNDKIEAFEKQSEVVEQASPEDDSFNVAEAVTKSSTNKPVTVVSDYRVIARELERVARKTFIVTIIDNDQRVNNHTTSCTVNCSNEYFDLGTLILPLNEKVEVRQGHLDVLKEVRIPQHISDPNNKAVSMMVMRPRYTIQYEQVKA